MEKYYIGLDGDSIGREVERLIISNEEEKLQMFSYKITETINDLSAYLIEKGINIIFAGGDSILAYGEINEILITELLDMFEKKTKKTVSIGIGKTLSDVYLGLKLAKANGGNQFINYTKKI